MTLGAWRHADEPPPVERMADHMSEASQGLWEHLVRWLGRTYGLEGEAAWEGEERGWVVRYRRGDRPLVTLSPTVDGGFGALVVVGPSLWSAVEEADLSEHTRAAFETATAYADGRWLWMRVHDADTVEDICTLVALKSKPPRRVLVPTP